MRAWFTRTLSGCVASDAERWAPVQNFEGLYEVSTHGRLKALARRVRGGHGHRPIPERILPGRINSVTGYVQIIFSDASTNRRRTAYLHRVVLETFVGAAPPNTQCCHNNGTKTDNQLSNLRWGTRIENAADAKDHGRLAIGEKAYGAKLTAKDVVAIRASTDSQGKLARQFGVSQTNISMIKVRKTWRHVP